MLGYQLFHATGDRFGPDTVLRRFAEQPHVCAELAELSDLLVDRVSLASAHPLPEPQWPLALHRRYSRREILTAVGRWSESQKPEAREGMVRLADVKTEIMFVTLDKSHRRFSPTTRYEDYAISDRIFPLAVTERHQPRGRSRAPVYPAAGERLAVSCYSCGRHLKTRSITSDQCATEVTPEAGR